MPNVAPPVVKVNTNGIVRVHVQNVPLLTRSNETEYMGLSTTQAWPRFSAWASVQSKGAALVGPSARRKGRIRTRLSDAHHNRLTKRGHADQV